MVTATRRSLPRSPATLIRAALYGLVTKNLAPEKTKIKIKPKTGRSVKEYNELRLKRRDRCRIRQERREVLMAKGKVNKPGGAPGKNHHYKPSEGSC